MNPLYDALKDQTEQSLPSFTFITPNRCDDMHDTCSPYGSGVSNGDQWLQAWMSLIVQSHGYLAHDTAIAPVYRSDGSGTNFLFSDYLSKASPKFKDTVGAATSVQWPVGIGAKARGSAPSLRRAARFRRRRLSSRKASRALLDHPLRR